MDINEVTLFGSIKEISNIQTLKNGQQCCWLNIFTDVSFHVKDGTVGRNQASHSVIVYGKYSHLIKERASTDQKIFIQGRLKTNNWNFKDMSFQKTFIVLERFKLHTSVQNESNDAEYFDQQQDIVDDENESEEELVFNNDWDSNDWNWNYYQDLVDSLELSKETGWCYLDDDSVDDWLISVGADHMGLKE